MAKLKNDENVNIHQNYTLFQLFCILSNTFSAIMHEVQSKTPYGKEYIECYQYFRDIVSNNLKVFQYHVRKCQDKQESEEK